MMEEGTYPAGERRKFTRLGSRLPLQYRGERAFRYVLTKDIGEGGIKFLSTDFIPVSSKLVVELSLHYAGEPLKAVGRVSWVQKLPYGDQYNVGMQFVDIAERNKAEIARFVNMGLRQSTS